MADDLLFPLAAATRREEWEMREFETLFEPVDAAPMLEHESCDEDTARRVAEPDPEAEQRSIQWTPELALMLAVLEDAIACYRRTLKRPRQNPAILARQAEFWIRLDDWESPFSFNNICEALGLEPRATRTKILGSAPAEKAA
jgi:hypothetical protein